MYSFSKTTNGFYLTSAKSAYLAKGNWPDDAVGGISQEQRTALAEGESSGKRISFDSEGYPVLIDPAAPTNAELRVRELTALSEAYQSDLQTLQSAWVSALIADGASEENRKMDIASDMADLKTQYLSDVSAVKLKYPL